MGYEINDRAMIEALCGLGKLVRAEQNALLKELKKDPSARITKLEFQHPLDEKVIGRNGLLRKLLPEDDTIGYASANELDKLWTMLLEKAILCLRYFDRRESFLYKEKPDIVAYGLDHLTDYHHRYTDFESLMYGANSHYRDHVFHAVRVWLLGVFCLTKKWEGGKTERSPFIDHITLDGGAEFPEGINFFEKISMWTIISLCHDLGYPLEKADQILSKTKNMMKEFIPHPNIWNDFGYSGVQDNINEYILRFISSKMVPQERFDEQIYIGRIQPKYYLKFAKSLEHFQHGIISSVIIFKILVYFMESDFNLNEDYTYGAEDARQFYIRREILRSIAAHTCKDAYNIHVTTFSSFLFLCDELQEWGRKSWNELYTGLSNSAVSLELECFDPGKVRFKETITTTEKQNKVVIDNIVRVFKRQYTLYKSTFRDGQDGVQKDFDLFKTMLFTLYGKDRSERHVKVEFFLPSTERAEYSGEISYFKVDLSELADDEKREFNKGIKQQISPILYGSDLKTKGIK